MNKELSKTLATALVQFIDRERPEGTMCCSNEECESLEYHIRNNHFDEVENLIKKKLTGLTEFEQCLLDYANARDEFEFDSTRLVELNNKVIELTKSYSKKLLALAKEQLLSYADESNPAIEAMADLERTYFCNPDKLPKWLKDDIARKELNAYTKGYNKGHKDAEKRYNESVAYHYPESVPTGVAYKSPQCYTDVLITPNTNSGTSTLKA